MDLIQMTMKNGEVLKGRAWTIKEPKANVIIVTGMLEHSLRYDNFAQELNNHGYDVFCLDQYGQGTNVNDVKTEYGIWPESGFSKSVKNCDELVSKLRVSCRPTYIFAHSMGSFMIQDYIQRYTEHVNKVVLCGSCGKQSAVSFGYFLSKFVATKKRRNNKSPFLAKLVLGSANKRIKNPKSSNAWLSYNEENVAKYDTDQLCGGVASGGFYREFLKGLNRLYKTKFLKKIRSDISILIISGQDDPVGHYGKGVEKLYKMYKKLGIKDVSMKLYPNMRHEILNETNNKEVYKDIIDFLDKEHDVAEQMLSNKK
jgi:alpha-beta hydrolase superfamily lysophospholipase